MKKPDPECIIFKAVYETRWGAAITEFLNKGIDVMENIVAPGSNRTRAGDFGKEAMKLLQELFSRQRG